MSGGMGGDMSDPAGASFPPTPAERREAARAAEAARRDADLAALRTAMPQAMAERRQWLVWKLVQRGKPGSKPAKVPYYVSGHLRGWPQGRPHDGQATDRQPQVTQDDPRDHAALVSLDDAIAALRRRREWAGIGFAFLHGDGLIGIDVDHAVDDAGQPSDLCRMVVESCASYTELSPSGSGVHVIVSGEAETFKDDALGLEVYAGGRYFTCTGRRPAGGGWPETPAEVQPIDPTVLAYLRELVMDSRARQAEARAAAAAAAAVAAPVDVPPAAEDQAGGGTSAAGHPPAGVPPPVVPTRPAPPPSGGGVHGAGAYDGGDDFKRVNEAAMRSLDAWVPSLLSEARRHRKGYRVTSTALGRELQEDLAIQKDGIVDYGVADMGDARQGKRTPIDLVLEYGSRVGVARPAEALWWLANLLGVRLARPALKRVHSAPAASRDDDGPPDDDAPPLGSADRPVRSETAAGADRPQGEGEGDAPGEGEGADEDGKWGGKKRSRAWWSTARMLLARYALVYSTDTAWDDAELMLVRIPALRLMWGNDLVKWWLSQPDRRWVRPTDLVFEPGAQVEPPRINMFGGLTVDPVACTDDDVRPMLDLLRHLCAESAPTAEGVATLVHWVLCWLALPLQKIGTKMQTALIFHGPQGTGKNLFFDMQRDIYGDYGITVGQAEIDDNKNAWASRKLFILADEVMSRAELYHKKNMLKALVTQAEKFPIRSMYMDVRWERNCANLVFTSNEDQPLALEERDRRYCVIYTPLEADAELYQRVRDFKAAGGIGKWLHYLLRYDVGEFDAHAKPPMTAAKEALIQLTWRPPERFAYEWLEGFLDLPVQVCSRDQLYRCFRRWCDLTGQKWPPDSDQFTRALNRWVGERVQRGADGKRELPRLKYKIVQVPVDDNGLKPVRKAWKVWLPQGTGFENASPMPGVTEGQWAKEAIEAFEHKVRAFCRSYGRSESDDGPPDKD